MLLATIGLSNSGIDLLAPSQANLIKAINVLEPTTNLLYKYNPDYTCLLVGAKYAAGPRRLRSARRQRASRSSWTRVWLLGDDPYHYPQNLPDRRRQGRTRRQAGLRLAAHVDTNWPVRQLITNTGFGTGVDWRPNPGIGFPGYANYLPGHPRGARAAEHPQPVRWTGARTDSVSRCTAPTARDLYAPDGTPLWPGLPPAPPPGAPRDPGPTPGSEPFVVPAPRNSSRHRCRRCRSRKTPHHRRDP